MQSRSDASKLKRNAEKKPIAEKQLNQQKWNVLCLILDGICYFNIGQNELLFVVAKPCHCSRVFRVKKRTVIVVYFRTAKRPYNLRNGIHKRQAHSNSRSATILHSLAYQMAICFAIVRGKLFDFLGMNLFSLLFQCGFLSRVLNVHNGLV